MEIGTWCSWGFWIGLLVAMIFGLMSESESFTGIRNLEHDYESRKSQAKSLRYEQISCIAIGVMLFSALTWLGYSDGFAADSYP